MPSNSKGEKTQDFRRARSSYLQEVFGMSEHSKPSADSLQELPQLATQHNHRGALKPRNPGPHLLPKSFTALVSGVAWLLGFTGFPGDSSGQPGLTTRSSDFWKRKKLKFLEHCIIPLTIVQCSRSVLSDSLQPQGLQHARLPCQSPTPEACSNSCPSSRWYHPTISSSVVPFSSYLQSFRWQCQDDNALKLEKAMNKIVVKKYCAWDGKTQRFIITNLCSIHMLGYHSVIKKKKEQSYFQTGTKDTSPKHDAMLRGKKNQTQKSTF